MANSEWKIGDNYFVQNPTHIIAKYNINNGTEAVYYLFEKVGSDLNKSKLIGKFNSAKEAKVYYATEIEPNQKMPSVPNLF